ncbi:MAG: c-type cytochrome [Betaproteobacteria bacterium]
MTATTVRGLFALSLSGLFIGTAAAQAPAVAPVFAPANLTAGGVRSLAANCAACHGTNGRSVGGAIPGLAGLNKEYFLNQVKAFKEGKREATVMHQISKGYSDAEMAALADYFSAQPK